ncbi:hypothetical protein ACIPPQ_14525 [Sphingopyxis sp. LARHCG72]
MRRPAKVRQYALAYFNRRIGPWRWTREEVEEYAIRRGDASRDRRTPKIVYLTVPADILERWVWVEAKADDNIVPLRVRPQLRLVK